MTEKKNQSFYMSANTKYLIKKNAEAMSSYGVHGIYSKNGEINWSGFLEQSMIILDKLFESRNQEGENGRQSDN